MKEGSIEAPIRHPVGWHDADFYDKDLLDLELRRQFDVCHGCRRCFNLCESFPRLFNLIDASESGELDTVDSGGFKDVVDACTLCDMCFMTKCPYVPPHEFNIDFPHLMQRYRAVELKERGKAPFIQNQLAHMDRNGSLAEKCSSLVNWGSRRQNKVMRSVMDSVLGIHKDVELPQFTGKTFVKRAKETCYQPNERGVARGRKAVLYATCYVNYNKPTIGEAAAAILSHFGVDIRVEYVHCCGMPFLEQGHLEKVADYAVKVSKHLSVFIDEGYDILTLTASCGLMFKTEWSLIVPGNVPIQRLAVATKDISEYIVDLVNQYGLPEGLQPVSDGIAVHLACHARAQNMGQKSAELLKFIPETNISVIERCSGHGGTFGVMKDTYDLAVKVGKPVTRHVAKLGYTNLVSDCPLAAKHIVQNVKNQGDSLQNIEAFHPVEIFARAYGLVE